MGALVDEVAREQAHLDKAYARLAELRGMAKQFAEAELVDFNPDAADAYVLRDQREAHGSRRYADLSVEDGLCFGRIDRIDGATYHIGRIGVADADQTPLVVDWRAPVAEPFYRATPGEPLGLVRRRHLMTRGRKVVGVDDEPLDLEAAGAAAAQGDLVLVGEAALLDAVTQRRTGRMRDIVATIQAEQDEVIRSPLAGLLVVQGGPGTGKTAVALHRAAYLLYRYRFPLEEQGVLVVGPNPVFLRYIERVLPSLGESRCLLTTIHRLYMGAATTQASGSDVAAVARVKGDIRMREVISRAVESRQRPLAKTVVIGMGSHRLKVSRKATARVVEAAKARDGTHNERRAFVERSLVRHLVAVYEAAVDKAAAARGIDEEEERQRAVPEDLAELLASSREVRAVLERIWPMLTPERLLVDLFKHRPLLDEATTGVLDAEEADALERAGPEWTRDDLPLLDEALELLGRKPAAARRGNSMAALSTDGDEFEAEFFASRITDELLGSGVLSMADRQMVKDVMDHVRRQASERADDEPPPLFPKFGHVVVDEAQELSPMQWRVLARRAASLSMTVVGDLNQASGDSSVTSWDAVVDAVGARRATVGRLRVNYRTPSEVMALADRLLTDGDRSEGGARCVRDAGVDPSFIRVDAGDIVREAVRVAGEELAATPGGKVGVVAPVPIAAEITSALGLRPDDSLDADITVLDPDGAKGLEFDAVVVVEPARFSHRSLYVALTRTTTRLAIVHAAPLPAVLAHESPAA